MTGSIINEANELSAMLDFAGKVLKQGKPQSINFNTDYHSIEYGEDEDGTYAIIGFSLPHGWYAEIDSRTYGELQGFRVYLNEIS